MSKTYKGDVTGNVVELNLLDANESTLPNLGTPTVVTRNTGPNDVTQVVGDITVSSGFSFDSSAKGLVIGTSCSSIGVYAFQFCQGLTGSLTIPDSVIIIGNNAFDSCSGLTGSLTIGNSVTSIGSHAFYGCSGFSGDLVIPDSVTTIEDQVFYNGSGFTGNLVIPDSVATIGSNAFYYCGGLTAVYTNTPASSFTGSNAFYGTTFTTIYTGPNATGYTSSFQDRTGLTIANWDNYPNPIPN